jgi:NAD(P)H-hydrate epimerase
MIRKYVPGGNFEVMSREQVRAFDSWAINELGVPGVVLMENAGRSCAEIVKDGLAGAANPSVCIFCGTGNNGGDGYVIARHLLNAGIRVRIVLCGERSKVKGDARTNLSILERLGQPVEPLDLSEADLAERVKVFGGDADMLVDGLFGTGLSGDLHAEYKTLVESVNSLNGPILAIDIPSGLDCDTGRPLGAAVRATWTVTFVAVKKGFVTAGAVQYTGEIFVASIGVEPISR